VSTAAVTLILRCAPASFTSCALLPFRFGTNPFLAPRSDEWKQAAAARLAALKRSAAPAEPSQRQGLAPAHDPAGVLQPKKVAAAG
jgi:hypothetical protein